ncbi:hypothetical protein [Amycolatopsis balhimycina]|uniref:hypothetical protein n=1 Tax=Amycolatopsis balhimycina TaxID=208443 RepID=UPI0003A360DD|nr:hypothetical protein [Amycolatopsis balhimycina]
MDLVAQYPTTTSAAESPKPAQLTIWSARSILLAHAAIDGDRATLATFAGHTPDSGR